MLTTRMRRILLFVPLAFAVACSSPTNDKYPQPTDPPKQPHKEPPQSGTMQPAAHDTVNGTVTVTPAP